MNISLILLIILFGSLTVVLLFMGISYILSHISGWQKLAKIYTAIPYQTTMPTTSVYAIIGVIRYNGVLEIGCSSEGLLMKLQPIFKVGHTPLFIAWEFLKNKQKKNFMFVEYYQFEIQGVTIKIAVSSILKKDAPYFI